MKNSGKIKSVLVIALFVLLPVIGFCANADKERGQGPQGGPPPEAITACEGKDIGETTSFSGRRGEKLEATCMEIEGQIAAVPEGHPR